MKYPKYIDYTLLLIGAIFLLFEQAKDEEANIFILISSLIVFMYALYRVTNIWTKANPRKAREDFPSLEDTIEQEKDED